MPWFNVDDGFYDHPKVDDLPLDAVGLWTLSGAYCMRQLTDGEITESRVRKFGGTPESVDALLESGLWIRTSDGYQFKDWGDWQLTRAQVEEKREKERLRKQKQRRDSDGKYTGTPPGTPENVPPPVPVGHPRDSRRDSARSHTVQSNPIQSNPSTGAQKRPTPLPTDWEPSEEHITYARENRIDLDFEAQKFRNHCAANGKTYKNHNAAFSNWIRTDWVRKLPDNQPTALPEWMTRG